MGPAPPINLRVSAPVNFLRVLSLNSSVLVLLFVRLNLAAPPPPPASNVLYKGYARTDLPPAC